MAKHDKGVTKATTGSDRRKPATKSTKADAELNEEELKKVSGGGTYSHGTGGGAG